jgi:hypothetical protein
LVERAAHDGFVVGSSPAKPKFINSCILP